MPEQRIRGKSDAAGAAPAVPQEEGREQLLEQLFRRNYSGMVRLASVLLGDDAEAADVVQDIFLRVADSGILPDSDRYLLTAVRNACLNRIRQMRLHDRVKNLLPIDEEADRQPVDRQLERLDDIAAYVDSRLEEPHRSIFHLRFDDDLTVAEIARRLGLNPNTAYKYLMQGIRQIRKHFAHP